MIERMSTRSQNATASLTDIYRNGSRIHRCTGSADEVDRWQRGESFLGWRIAGGRPRPGDLLLGVTGAPAYIVDLAPVERIGRMRGEWFAECSPDDDLHIRPAVAMNAVLLRAEARIAKNWTVLEGDLARCFLDAVADAVRAGTATTDSEALRSLSSCRKRSRRNRREAIERERGRCQACGIDFRERFGPTGDRALEAHHRHPLAGQPEGTIVTSSDDLVVLCATCHRLTHATTDVDWQAVAASWRVN